MTTATARYKREVAIEQAALRDNLQTLEDTARRFTDWRRPVRARPMEAASTALAAGLLIGLLAGPRGRKAAATDDQPPGTKQPAHPLIDRFVATVAAIVAERAVDALSAMLPQPSPDVAREPRTQTS